MTDHEKDDEEDHKKSSEGFLQRWSRKKFEAEHEASDAAANAPVPAPDEPAASSTAPGRDRDRAPASAKPKPEFDPASLPSLDSITAATDIRAFLAPGVPKELKHAALRRAWSADPAIRDFVGLAENAWDFTAPGAIEGFGELPADFDVKKLVARVFGEDVKAADPSAGTAAGQTSGPETSVAAPAEDTATAEETSVPVASGHLSSDATQAAAPAARDATNDTGQVAVSAGDGFVHRDKNNFALQNTETSIGVEETKTRRQHGGALPQ